MDTAEHPNWGSHGRKGNVNLLKLDVNFFHLMILIARFPWPSSIELMYAPPPPTKLLGPQLHCPIKGPG